MRSSLACRLAAACLLALALCAATAAADQLAVAGFDLDASVDAQPLTLAQEQAVDFELQALGVSAAGTDGQTDGGGAAPVASTAAAPLRALVAMHCNGHPRC